MELKAYFQNRKAFSISGLEKEAGIPKYSLHKFLKGHQQLTKESIDKITNLLTQKYGLKDKQ